MKTTLALDLPVKIISGSGLDEILNFDAILSGNLDVGVLELSRQGAELPFINWPWQQLENFDGEEKGRVSKKKLLYIKLTDNSSIQLELKGKHNLKEVIFER